MHASQNMDLQSAHVKPSQHIFITHLRGNEVFVELQAAVKLANIHASPVET